MRRIGWDAVLWALSATAFTLLVAYYMRGEGRLDAWSHARGRDFVIFWTAGQLLHEGRVLEVFDPHPFLAAAHRLFDPRLPFHFWSYPPPALLLIAPLALFRGYFSALIAWSLAGIVALWAALEALLGAERRGWTALVLLSPAVATNLALGQNGAFTAALLLGGLALVDRRPALAGALLGLLIFKPQIALLLPVVVLAGARWRVLAGAAVSALAAVALSTVLFGFDAWRAFFAHTLPMQAQMLQHGWGPFLLMMPSAFASARLVGAPYAQALLVQAPFAALAAWLTWKTWRATGLALNDRVAITALATFVATPQAFNYDLIPAAFAALALWRASPRWPDRLAAAGVWAIPVAMIPLGLVRLPIAPLLLIWALWRLYALRVGPSRAASASAAGELASNT